MRKLVVILIVLLETFLGGIHGVGSAETAADRATLDWPQWRGANRDAVSSETGLIDKWPEDGPRVAWRIEIGEGFSSVSVAHGRLYTLWDERDAQFLVCLDAATGRERWRRSVGKTFTSHYGNGPRSTPLVHDGVVYAVGTDGRLVALNGETGEPVWEHDLVGEFGAKLPSYGYSSSPLIVGDKLVIEAGAKEATFMAFHSTDGKVAWRSENDAPAYSSPIHIRVEGVEQVVFWSAHGLHAVSPDDGEVLWRYAWETFCPVTGDPLNTGTPIFVEPDRIYISSGSGAALIRLTRKEKKFTVETVWESDEMRNDVNTSLLLGQHIYGFDRGTLKCLDVRTGDVRWKARGFQRGSLIAADGKLIVFGETGNLAIVEASPDGFVQEDAAQLTKGRNWTTPTLAAGRLYLRNHDELVCVEMKSLREGPT